MLIVNNIALDSATPSTLTHADWSGEVHIADLVFPWFLFTVGLSIPWSMHSLRSRGATSWEVLVKFLLRTMILLVLGFCLDSAVAHHIVIGLGVLQMIGLSYLFGALLQLAPLWSRFVLAIVAMLSHWLILKFLPVPGSQAAVFTESTNAIKFLNDVYLEPHHLRGLLSVLTTGPLVFIGTLFGESLRAKREAAWRTLFLGGIILVACGLGVQLDLPMNKPLWTASYVLFTGGLAAWTLCAMHLLLDRHRFGWLAKPLVVLGSNAIFIYVVPILLKGLVLQTIRLSNGRTLGDSLILWSKVTFGPVTGGLLYTSCYIVTWWLVLYVMYRRRWFAKI